MEDDFRTELFHDHHFEGDDRSHYFGRVRELAEQGWELISMAPHRMGAVALFHRAQPRLVSCPPKRTAAARLSTCE